MKIPTRIFALGGLQEIGKSTIVVEYDDELIIIDCGIKFADSWISGVDGIVPDYQYLKKNQHKIKGLFITHPHEDHIGGIPYLLKEVKIPMIYCPKLGIEYIKNKLKEHKLSGIVDFTPIEKDTKVQFKHLTIDVWTAQHSIPDAFGIRVKTPNGTVADTGDFRFDYTPIGNKTDFDRMEQIGNEGLDLLLSDSTNAMTDKHSPSEKGILLDIEKFMRQAKGKIIFTTFASNQTRVRAVIELAEKLKRKVVTFGRSMVTGVDIGVKLGNINISKNTLIDKKQISKYEDNELFILTTGSQGEKFSALVNMANNKHAQVSLKKNDLIIFSASPIPGNRVQIEQLINKLSKLQVIIKQHKIDGYLHTSGHAYHDEHVKTFQLLKPKYFLPYHGEFRMSVVHAATAMECGIPEERNFLIKNGQVLEMIDHKIRLTDEKIDVGPLYIDGKIASKTSSRIINERESLSQQGFINVSAIINKKENRIIGRTRLMSRGAFYVNNIKDEMVEAQKIAHGSILYFIKNDKNWTTAKLNEILKIRIRNYFYKIKKRNPIIIPSINVI